MIRTNKLVFCITVFSLVLSHGVDSRSDIINYQNLLDVVGNPTGQLGWSEFTGGYEGPHAPNAIQIGGTGSLSVSPGGFPPGASTNLYSFMSVPVYTIDLNSLDDTEQFTSLVVQFAIGTELDSNAFLLSGIAPTEFELTGSQTVNVPNIGDVDFNYYWAEWQGLSASDAYQLVVSASAQHVSLAGVKLDYFNTPSSSLDIIATAIPEPTSGLVLIAGFVSLMIRRKRN